MDFMYNLTTLQDDFEDTNEKLQYDEKITAELQALRGTICTVCKQRYAASSLPASPSTHRPSTTPNDSTLVPSQQHHVEDETPTLLRMPKMNAFWGTLTSCLSYLSINDAITTISNSLAEISTEVNVDSESESSNNPTFFVQRDGLADTVVDVTFVHFFCHARPVSCVCFSDDARYLAVATGDEDNDNSSVVIYELESHKIYCELREYVSQYGSYKRPRIWFLFFSFEGRYLAVADVASRIIIWDVPNKRIRSIFHSSHGFSEVLFSPDERLVAFHTETELFLLNMRENSRKMVFAGKHLDRLDFSPGGQYIATGNHGGDVEILQVRTGRVVKRWNGNGPYLHCIKFTSGGRELICAYGEVIEHWNVNDAEPVLIRKFDFKSHSYLFTISPDNQFFAHDNEVWDFNSSKRQCKLTGHTNGISSLDFTVTASRAYLAMGSFDHFVSLWKYTLACQDALK